MIYESNFALLVRSCTGNRPALIDYMLVPTLLPLLSPPFLPASATVILPLFLLSSEQITSKYVKRLLFQFLA
jgi:hypothetical protein